MVEIIDFHTHIFPDEIARKAIPQLELTSNTKACLDGTAAGLIASMRAAGISRSALMPIATKPEQVRSINTWIAAQDRAYFIPFGTLHPKFDRIEEECQRMRELGIRGIKMHSNYQDFFPDDEFMFPLYEALVRHRLILLIHAGEDLSFREIMASPERTARVLEQFPDLTVVAAHFGAWKQWNGVQEHLIGKNIYLDTSYTFDYLPSDVFIKMAREHGIEKILFASDSPWDDQRKEVETVMRLRLSDEEKEMIFSRNAKELLASVE
jgi:predicted TIM-barrel fold metal-dependent hydrolase